MSEALDGKWYRCTGIKWDDAPDDLEGTKDVFVPADVIAADTVDDFLGDALSDATGYCHLGFDFEERPAEQTEEPKPRHLIVGDSTRERTKRKLTRRMVASIPKVDLEGIELLRWTMNKILANPKAWSQDMWHCGTSHCFFGWAEIGMLGGKAVDAGVGNHQWMLIQHKETVAAKLGLNVDEMTWVTDAGRTLRELWLFCRMKVARNGEALILRDSRDLSYHLDAFQDSLDNSFPNPPYAPV